jgi:FkbM family methyltransferase
MLVMLRLRGAIIERGVPSRPCVVVLTYSRPDSLGLLLGDLERESPSRGLDVRVYDDGTPHTDDALERRIRRLGWRYQRAEANHGKRGWWRWWNTILADLRIGGGDVTYVLNDDMRLCERFFERSVALWGAIDDPRKASLYLHLSPERAQLGSSCWTPVRAAAAGPVVHCGWVDCAAFMCERRLFEALDWRLSPIDERRWHRDVAMSSGVGQQISVRLHGLGLRMYRVAESLTVHDGGPSLMSREARSRWTMETVEYVDGADAAHALTRARDHVFASVASIPQREPGLRRVVDSLLPQVDELGVYLNGYERIPAFLKRDGVVVARSQDHGLRADAGKFFWVGSTGGYQLVCDDDILYPPDYVDRLVGGIDRHGRRAVVGFHGCTLRNPIIDYHTSRQLLHFSSALATDTAVHVLGTGVAGFHASAVRVEPDDFEPMLADLSLALLGQRAKVPFVCLQRPARWLSDVPDFLDDSIYARAGRASAVSGEVSAETRLARSLQPWQIYPSPHRAATPAAAVRGLHRLPPRRNASSPRPLLRVPVAGPARRATLVLPSGDHITEMVRRSGTYYERDLLDAIRARISGGTFVDVGAHYGNHTTFFALECCADRVVAIEPNPAAVAGLTETVAENRLESVEIQRAAAHPVWRSVQLTALPWEPQRGTSVRANSGRMGIRAAADGRGDAPAAPLDELLMAEHDISVVKVDAQGSSAEVLRSAARVLLRDRPLVAADAASDTERVALRAFLSRLNYREIGRYCWTPTWLWEAG